MMSILLWEYDILSSRLVKKMSFIFKSIATNQRICYRLAIEYALQSKN